jgi:DNA-binding NarL/FixJ family response regulator
MMRGLLARTIVVDDHDIARLGLVAILESIPGVRVVAEASDAMGAIEAVRTHRPDLVLMDVRMPDTEGLAATRQICAGWPNTRVVMVSYWDVPEYRIEAFRAGATGYISKGAPRDEIVDEVDRVLRGEPRQMSLVNRGCGLSAAGRSSGDAFAAVDRLTPRQRQVLALTAAGLSNREIGDRLGIAWRTVQKTMERVFRQLGVPNRTQAAMIWVLAGWDGHGMTGAGPG